MFLLSRVQTHTARKTEQYSIFAALLYDISFFRRKHTNTQGMHARARTHTHTTRQKLREIFYILQVAKIIIRHLNKLRFT